MHAHTRVHLLLEGRMRGWRVIGFHAGLAYSLDEVRSGCARGDNGAMRVHARRKKGRTFPSAGLGTRRRAHGGFP